MQFRKVYIRPAKQDVIQEQGSQGEDTTAGVSSVCCVHVLRVLTHQHAIKLIDGSAAANCFSLGSRKCALAVAEDTQADGPTAPTGKWEDPLKKSVAFGQLQQLMQERIIFIDGAMGTSIQKHR